MTTCGGPIGEPSKLGTPIFGESDPFVAEAVSALPWSIDHRYASYVTPMPSSDPIDQSTAPATDWERLPSDSASLFTRLRELGPAEIHLRFGMGTTEGFRVEVPAVSLILRGMVSAEAVTDRFSVQIEDWGEGDFAWFARRKGRGRTDYWQAAIEYRPSGRPAVVLYLTAPLDGIEIQVRPRR